MPWSAAASRTCPSTSTTSTGPRTNIRVTSRHLRLTERIFTKHALCKELLTPVGLLSLELFVTVHAATLTTCRVILRSRGTGIRLVFRRRPHCPIIKLVLCRHNLYTLYRL